jgi:hypothetical protein
MNFFLLMEKCYLQNGVYKKKIHIVALYFFERTFMLIKILEFLGSILNLKYILLKSTSLPNYLKIM